MSSLNERIDQLTRELESEQTNTKSLEAALADAQEQHEISTEHFEVCYYLNILSSDSILNLTSPLFVD